MVPSSAAPFLTREMKAGHMELALGAGRPGSDKRHHSLGQAPQADPVLGQPGCWGPVPQELL